MRSLYWFRNDLRLNDNLSLNLAVKNSDAILFVHINDIPKEINYPWRLLEIGQHRKLFLSQGLSELKKNLSKYGHQLNLYTDNSVRILSNLVKKYQIDTIYCELINAPDEIKQIKLLEDMKINVVSFFHSSLFMQNQLPFSVAELPNIFSDFRKAIESGEVKPNEPVSISKNIFNIKPITDNQSVMLDTYPLDYSKSSFPITQKNFIGGEESGIVYLKKYFQSNKAESYKHTRNELTGINFSTKFSPWLSLGYISARQVFSYLDKYENNIKKNESTYWIFFELLWRDHFRFIMIKYGEKLFYKRGLNLSKQNIKHDDTNFELWTSGKTKNKFINAGMNELRLTGFLSNRMRQIVASYLVNELGCDWRAGASWFESKLIDYDVYSNQGNWAYIAGCGTDPRGGRFFNVEKQQKTYDRNSIYQLLWNS